MFNESIRNDFRYSRENLREKVWSYIPEDDFVKVLKKKNTLYSIDFWKRNSKV